VGSGGGRCTDGGASARDGDGMGVVRTKRRRDGGVGGGGLHRGGGLL
jgi:hypothetical protein